MFFLYHQFAKKKGIFTIWKNPSFWSKYVDIEIAERRLKATDQAYLTLLSEIVFKLSDLNLENKLILSLVSENLAIKLIKNVNFFQL